MCEEAEEREAEEALDEEAVTRKYRTIFEESRYVLHIGRRQDGFQSGGRTRVLSDE